LRSHLLFIDTEKRRTTPMKFLTIILQKQSPPPEMLPALVEATIQWMAWAKGSGKFDTIYSIAGQPGGLGIANVDSLEELDDLIQGYPMTPFCDVQTLPLSDVDRALTTLREQVKKMGASGG
jgi:muconolactone delta-isomerase